MPPANERYVGVNAERVGWLEIGLAGCGPHRTVKLRLNARHPAGVWKLVDQSGGPSELCGIGPTLVAARIAGGILILEPPVEGGAQVEDRRGRHGRNPIDDTVVGNLVAGTEVAGQAGQGIDNPVLVLRKIRPAAVDTVLLSHQVIQAQTVVVVIEATRIIGPEVVVLPGGRARRGGVRVGIQRGNLRGGWIDSITRNDVTGKRGAQPVVVFQPAGERIINGYEPVRIVEGARKVAAPLVKSRDRGERLGGELLRVAKPFPTEKEESLVTPVVQLGDDHRSADGESILIQRGTRARGSL